MPVMTSLETALYGGAVAQLQDQMTDLSRTAGTKYAAGVEKALAGNKKLFESYLALTGATNELEARNSMLNKGFGVSYQTAAGLSQQFHKTGQALGISSYQVKEYGVNLKKLIPTYNQMKSSTSAQFKGLVQIQKILNTNLGLSEQVAGEYIALAASQGTATDNFNQTLAATAKLVEELDPKGEMGYFQQIGEQLGKAGADVTLQFGKIPGQLELAALKANQLGLELSQLKNTGKQLLNIESSIGDELEYQLLSGRRLVGNENAKAEFQGKSLTNAYRMAMIQGDMNKQADILNTILSQEGDVLENNMFAREQMAKMLGMEEGALSGAIQKRKILERLKQQGGIDLFAEQGEDLINKARSAFQKGAMTKQDFEKLELLTDQRSSEEILKDQLQKQEDIAYFTLYSAKQLDIIKQAVSNNANYAKGLLLVGQQGGEDEATFNANMETRFKDLGTKYLSDVKAGQTQATVLSNMAGAVGTGTTINASIATGATGLDDGVIINPAAVVNDAVIRANPKDKLLKVNDAVTVVGTNEGGNQALAQELGGGRSAMTSNQINQLIQAFNSVGLMLKSEHEKLRMQIKQDRIFAPGLNSSTWG